MPTETSPSAQTPAARRQKRRPSKRDADVPIKDEDTTSKPIKTEKTTPPPVEPSESNDAESPRDMDVDGADDPFAAGFLGSGRGPPLGLSSSLRALSGMMSGMSSRLRDILNSLRQLDNPTMQLVGLSSCLRLFRMSLSLEDMPDIMPLRARRELERPRGGPRPLPRKPAAKGSSAPSTSMSRGLSASLLSLGSTGGGVVFSVLIGLEVVSSSLIGTSASRFEGLLFWRRAAGVCADGEVSVGMC